jgi:hypothetical protein
VIHTVRWVNDLKIKKIAIITKMSGLPKTVLGIVSDYLQPTNNGKYIVDYTNLSIVDYENQSTIFNALDVAPEYRVNLYWWVCRLIIDEWVDEHVFTDLEISIIKEASIRSILIDKIAITDVLDIFDIEKCDPFPRLPDGFMNMIYKADFDLDVCQIIYKQFELEMFIVIGAEIELTTGFCLFREFNKLFKDSYNKHFSIN